MIFFKKNTILLELQTPYMYSILHTPDKSFWLIVTLSLLIASQSTVELIQTCSGFGHTFTAQLLYHC